MKLYASNEPCYCTECAAPNATQFQFENPAVVQPGSFALCPYHMMRLYFRLGQQIEHLP